MARRSRPDLYISADIEADGPIPGPYSMLSFGLCVAGTFDGVRWEARDPTATTFYRELRPISDLVDERALAISGLNRAALARTGAEPATAMAEATAWVKEAAGARRPVLVAYPLSFDWMFLHWYWIRFQTRSPFGHASCLDIKTIYQQRTGRVLDQVAKSTLPPELRPTAPHTHNALDDAVEQAELLSKLLAWRSFPGG
ncbi:MAG: 3'-5' exonuclease [Egibacteraceae bacterium]